MIRAAASFSESMRASAAHAAQDVARHELPTLRTTRKHRAKQRIIGYADYIIRMNTPAILRK